MVQRVPGEGALPAVRGDLDDAAATLGAEVRQRCPDEPDRPEEVGGDEVTDLRVSELLRRAEQAVAGVADDDVNAAELGERAVDDLVDRSPEDIRPTYRVLMSVRTPNEVVGEGGFEPPTWRV